MRTISVMLLLLAVLASPASAMDNGAAEELERLDPQTRLEQRCDLEAMERIHKDPAKLVPDELIAYAFEEPKINGNKIRSTALRFAARASGITCLIAARHRLTT